MSSWWRHHRRGAPAFAPARRRHASCVRGGGKMKPIRRLLDLMARRRLRRTAARRIREMLAAADSGRRLGSFATTSIPFGNYPAPTVTRFNLGPCGGTAIDCSMGIADIGRRPSSNPARHSFAYSEPQWLTGLVASPFWWISGSPPLAYNAVLLLAFTLNGWGGYFLLRRDASLQHRQAEPEGCRGVDRDGDGVRSARADIRLVGRGQHEA